MLSVIMLSVIMLSVIMLSVIMLSVIMLSVIMLIVVMLSVFFKEWLRPIQPASVLFTFSFFFFVSRQWLHRPNCVRRFHRLANEGRNFHRFGRTVWKVFETKSGVQNRRRLAVVDQYSSPVEQINVGLVPMA
jgi:hypothetical protein